MNDTQKRITDRLAESELEMKANYNKIKTFIETGRFVRIKKDEKSGLNLWFDYGIDNGRDPVPCDNDELLVLIDLYCRETFGKPCSAMNAVSIIVHLREDKDITVAFKPNEEIIVYSGVVSIEKLI